MSYNYSDYYYYCYIIIITVVISATGVNNPYYSETHATVATGENFKVVRDTFLTLF